MTNNDDVQLLAPISSFDNSSFLILDVLFVLLKSHRWFQNKEIQNLEKRVGLVYVSSAKSLESADFKREQTLLWVIPDSIKPESGCDLEETKDF